MSALEIITSLGANAGLFAKGEEKNMLLIEFAWKKTFKTHHFILQVFFFFGGTLCLERGRGTLVVFHIHLEVNGQVSGF